MSKSISFSAIKEFMMCPQKYYLHRVVKAEPEFLSSALIFGCSIHAAIAYYNEGRELTTLSELMEAYDEEWDKMKSKSSCSINYREGESEKKLRVMARRMLRAFLKDPKNSGEPLIVEDWIREKLSDDLPLFIGKVDLVEVNEDFDVIVDYKTASSKRKQDMTQLILYYYALKKSGKVEDPVRLKFVIITKEKRPEVYEQVCDFDTEEIEEAYENLLKEYLKALEQIEEGKFERTVKNEWLCGFCEYGTECLQRLDEEKSNGVLM